MKIKALTLIFICALALTFWINFIDLKLKTFSIFINKADKLNAIIDNLSLAFIGGYFFYFLNVYLVERNEKKHILPFIAEKTGRIINGNNEIIRILKQNKEITEYNTDVKEFKTLVTLDRIEKLIVYNFTNLTFRQYLEGNRNNTLSSINKILNSGKHVDDELRAILFHLDEAFFLQDNFTLDNPNSYNIFFEYFQDIQKLNMYFNNNLKKYYNPRTYTRSYTLME